MKIALSPLVVTLMLSVASVSRADPIEYSVSQTVGAGSVSGYIETDGTVGTLTTANILDWNLEVANASSSTDLLGPLSGNNSGVDVVGSGLSATADDLLFDFNVDGFAIFQGPTLFDGIDLVCYQGGNPNGGCTGDGPSQEIVDGPQGPNEHNFGLSGTQVIGTVATPEPASGFTFGSALALFALLRNQRNRIRNSAR